MARKCMLTSSVPAWTLHQAGASGGDWAFWAKNVKKLGP